MSRGNAMNKDTLGSVGTGVAVAAALVLLAAGLTLITTAFGAAGAAIAVVAVAAQAVIFVVLGSLVGVDRPAAAVGCALGPIAALGVIALATPGLVVAAVVVVGLVARYRTRGPVVQV